jgi:thiamine biosynthesis lipoprotein
MAVAPAPARRARHARRRAMGSDAHVVVVADAAAAPDLHRAAWLRIDELEQRWSRFLPGSEVTALNRGAGRPVAVSDDTFTLVARAVEAWRLTGGRFDPSVGAAVLAHGYDRDIDRLAGTDPPAPPAPRPAPGLAGVVLDPWLPAVTLPRGSTFDPGGIGKGLAADLVVGALRAAGAAGALVGLGGDLRAAGTPPVAEGWVVTVPDPLRPRNELARLAIPGGGVATSSPLRRRWRTGAGAAHHLVDPAGGRPASAPAAAVTVVAAEAWWAEAVATSLCLAGAGRLDRHPGVHALAVAADGSRHATPDMADLLR